MSPLADIYQDSLSHICPPLAIRLRSLRLRNNYISDASREELISVFEGNLRPVIIDGEEHEEMEAVHITRHEADGETWFTLRDMPEAKKAERKIRADIEYLAMMTDNELEEDD